MKRIIKLTVSALCLSLLVGVSGCGRVQAPKNSQEDGNTPTQAEKRVESVSKDIDPVKARTFVNESGLLAEGLTLGPDSVTYKLDFNKDGNEDLCIVPPADGGHLSPVAFMSQDPETGQLTYVPSTVYADIDFLISMEGDFIVRSQADGTGFIKQLYCYDEEIGIVPLMNGSFMTGKQVSIENYHEKTQFIYEHSLEQEASYFDFNLKEETYFVDERGDKHHFSSKTRHYLLNEEEKSYDIDESTEKDYEDVHTLRAQVGYYGKEINLDTFDTVLEKEGLIEALKYYKDHRYDFDSDSKSAYVYAAYEYMSQPIFKTGFTDIYDLGYEELGLKIQVNGPNPVKEGLQEVYTLCKTYYAMEGQVDVMGYEYAVTDIDVSKLINMIVYDRHLYKESGQGEIEDPFEDRRVDLVFTTREDILAYPFAYPRVLVKNQDDINRMRHEDVWKTWILFPVEASYSERVEKDYHFNALEVGDKIGAFLIDEIDTDVEGQKMFLAMGHKTFEGRIEKDIIMADAYQFYSYDLAFDHPLRVGEKVVETLDYAYIENQSIVPSSISHDLVEKLEAGEPVAARASVSRIEYKDHTGLSIHMETLEAIDSDNN